MKFKKIINNALAALLAIFTTTITAAAGVNNPAMGDTQGKYIGVVLAVLIISLIVVVVMAVIFSKKK